MAKERPKRRIVQPCLEYNQGLLHEEELALRKALYASLVDVKKISAKAKGEANSVNNESKGCGTIDGSSKKRQIINNKISSSKTAAHSGNTSDISVNTPESARRFSTEMQIELKRRHIMLKQSNKLVRSAIKKQKSRKKSWNSFKSKLINKGLTRGVGTKHRISCSKELSPTDNVGVKKLKKEKKSNDNKQLESMNKVFETEKNVTSAVSSKDLQHPHLKTKNLKRKKRRKNMYFKGYKSELSTTANCDASLDSPLAKKPRAENKQSRSNKLIRAQRKFPSSCPLTPSSLKQQQETIEIQATRANTEDFLTFLCLRGHTTLPKDLQMFSNPNVPLSPLSSDDEDNETLYSPSPSQSQVLSPASFSSNPESSTLSTQSPLSRSEKVTHSEKHAVKAQAEFHQGLAGGKRARTEERKLCEPPLTDTDDDGCMSVTPPLLFGNTERVSVNDNGNSIDDSRPSSPGGSDSYSKSPVAHPQSPINAQEGSRSSLQQCCSPPPLLYIPVAAQKVTHLHGPPELKRFPSPSNLAEKSVSLTENVTQIEKHNSIIASEKRTRSKNVDSLPRNNSIKGDTSKEIISSRTSQTSNRVTADLSISLVNNNRRVSRLKRPPVSRKKASPGFHLVGSPTRFRGMLEDFSCVIHKQPNPSAILDEKTEEESSDRLFSSVKEQQFPMSSYSPPPLRHVHNLKQKSQTRLLSPPQLTPVTSRMGSPSFITDNSSSSNIYISSTKPSIRTNISSVQNVAEISYNSSPSPPTLTPVTRNFSHSTIEDLDSRYRCTPSPPKLSSVMPNIFCPRTVPAAKPWMPVLDRVSAKSSVGHYNAMQKESKVVGYTCYPSALSENLLQPEEPKTPSGIPRSLTVGSRTSYHSRFHPYANSQMIPHSSASPMFDWGPSSYSSRSTERVSSPKIVKQIFVDGPFTSAKNVTHKAENIQRESAPLLDDRSSNCIINGDQRSSPFFPLMERSDLYEDSACVEIESIKKSEVQNISNCGRKTLNVTNTGQAEPLTSLQLLSDNNSVVEGNKFASTTFSDYYWTKKTLQTTNVATKTTNLSETSSEKVVTIDLIRNDVLSEAGKKPKEKLQGCENGKCGDSRSSDNILDHPSNFDTVLGKEIDSQNKFVRNKKVVKHNLKNKTNKIRSSLQKDTAGSSLNCENQELDSLSDCEKKHILTFSPNEEEFKDPIRYLHGVVQKAQLQGICVVVPPPTWKPEVLVPENLRLHTECQYIHKLKSRFGPVEQQLACIKHCMQEQKVSLSPMPKIGGYEIDLPRFSKTVKQFGGIEKLNDRKSWLRVADKLRVSKSVQDRVGRLQTLYLKCLLPYDRLSQEEMESVQERVKQERELSEARSQSEGLGKGDCDSSCFEKGQNMSIVLFQRAARNIQEHCFKNDPTSDEVEREFWNIVESSDRYVCVYKGAVDTEHKSCFPTNKGNPYSRSGWNLNILPLHPSSVLRHFGATPGITIPWLQLDMALSTSGWQTNPLGLCNINYLHTGAEKIWYSVPTNQKGEFLKALASCAGLREPYVDTKHRLTYMASPDSLREKGISINRVVQKPGQFVVTLPKAYHCTVGCGMSIAEAVAFAPSGWIRRHRETSEELAKTPYFHKASYEKFIIGAAEQLKTNDNGLIACLLEELTRIRNEEIKSRKHMLEVGLTLRDSCSNKSNIQGKRGKKAALKGNIIHFCEKCGQPCFFSAIFQEDHPFVLCHKDATRMISEQNSTDGLSIVTLYDMSKLDKIIGRLQFELEKRSFTAQTLS